MKMQLILNTDSTVNLNTKMSLTEQNLDICVTTVLPATNGDLPNGDFLEENDNINYNKTGENLSHIKEIGHNKTDEELNQVINICSNNVDIELSEKQFVKSEINPEDDQQAKSATCNENDLNGLKESAVNLENENSDITAEQKHIEEIEAKIDFIDNCATNDSAASENVPVEDENAEDTTIENKRIQQGSIESEKSEGNSTEKCQKIADNDKVKDELNDTSSSNSAFDTNEFSIPEKDCTEEHINNKTILNGNISAEDNLDSTTTVTETEIKGLDESGEIIITSTDVSPGKNIEKRPNETIVEKETETINITSAVIENQTVLNEKDEISDKINDSERMVTEVDNENKLETEDLDSRDNHINNNEEMSSNHKEVDRYIHISENKSSIEEHKMDIEVDEKIEGRNLEDLEDKKGNSENTCDTNEINNDEPDLINTTESVTANAEEPMAVIPDSSEDIIFNLDDDDQSSNPVKVKQAESTKIIIDDDKPINCDGDNETVVNSNKVDSQVPKSSGEVIDLDESSSNRPSADSKICNDDIKEQSAITEESKSIKSTSPVLKLSNTLDILSDEEEDSKDTNVENKCINIEDDDDVMLIDEELSGTEEKSKRVEEATIEAPPVSKPESPVENMEVTEETKKNESVPELLPEPIPEKDTVVPEKELVGLTSVPQISEKVEENKTEIEVKKPLMHEKFLKTCKKSLADMTREELEEFCIVKIVESILDRSNLTEIRTKLKTMTQNVEEYKKKAMMLTKQNRDLQVVLKSIQEDQKKGTDSIVPLKITRSVGMQVLMSDKPVQRRKPIPPPASPAIRPRNPVPQSPRPLKPAASPIPVPRLVPANNPVLKSPNTPQTNAVKITSPVPNGVRNPSPVQKGEKRSHNRMQSVTVDLTDDEPPAKLASRAPPAAPVPPVRLVPSQNLLAAPRPQAVNSPRKVYIPISGPQGQNVRQGQTIMLKTVPPPTGGARQRCPPPHMVRVPTNVRMTRPQGLRHPAPLPDCMKQYQPPNWKALPPAPDLKLAKVENGIVISWKIEGYQEDSYEEIASYQLYAYQETSSPPSTALWKKIGDVKALPLPMACTLTQFMAGYKYYFAVRAVDIRSRLGPFSLPGSILLLNKM